MVSFVIFRELDIFPKCAVRRTFDRQRPLACHRGVFNPIVFLANACRLGSQVT